VGIFNHPEVGPWFVNGFDLIISGDCDEDEHSWSTLGTSYGGPGVDQYALFGQ
jgi:microcystin-dependent protein